MKSVFDTHTIARLAREKGIEFHEAAKIYSLRSAAKRKKKKEGFSHSSRVFTKRRVFTLFDSMSDQTNLDAHLRALKN